MKLWKENDINKEWDLENEEIVRRFLSSSFAKERTNFGITYCLINFITSVYGLNSVYEFDEEKGSIDGSEDILEMINLLRGE